MVNGSALQYPWFFGIDLRGDPFMDIKKVLGLSISRATFGTFVVKVTTASSLTLFSSDSLRDLVLFSALY